MYIYVAKKEKYSLSQSRPFDVAIYFTADEKQN